MLKESKNDTMEEKLEYLGLDLNQLPNSMKNNKPVRFRIPRFYDENQYKQYRYVPIKDIQILLSPTNRLDPIEERYKSASSILDYLDNQSEENFLKHTTFLNMLRQFKIKDIEKIAQEQANLNKQIPFKVKFKGNYLWQIYYSDTTDQYFMLVPTEDSDYSTFFFLLKKQLEKRRTGKIFVPIRNLEYSSKFFKKSEFEDIENYMWLFTKEWPLIYEVYDKDDNLSIHIVGETEVYDQIKSPYKIKLENVVQANRFYKLLKAMFILQTELPNYFKFRTSIDKNGSIEFYIEDRKVRYEDIASWLNEEYHIGEEKEENTTNLIEKDKKRLEELKIEIAGQEIEYLAKEKQISTFLECKKTFFGKFRYYFKYSGKRNKKRLDQSDIDNKNMLKDDDDEPMKKLKIQKDNYTIEEIIELYKGLERKENELKNIIMDINALKLKNKNMKKKIENAISFIEEIDSHKKSIFEFWKYSNKDEVATLPEGEAEEINVTTRVTKVFDYEEDIEKFGATMDELQREALSEDEADSVYLATTDAIEILNKVIKNDFTPKDIENNLKEYKKQSAEEKPLVNDEEFDIFGGLAQDSTKVSKIKDKKHREVKRDKFNILEINKNTNQIGYKLCLKKVVNNIKTAMQKVEIPEELPVYKAIEGEKLDRQKINLFNINPEKEIDKALNTTNTQINFYKINLKEKTKAVACTNGIFYENQNKTLPIGQDLSTQILIDTSQLNLKLQDKKYFRMVEFNNERDDFSSIKIKTVNLFEYDVIDDELTEV